MDRASERRMSRKGVRHSQLLCLSNRSWFHKENFKGTKENFEGTHDGAKNNNAVYEEICMSLNRLLFHKHTDILAFQNGLSTPMKGSSAEEILRAGSQEMFGNLVYAISLTSIG